MGFLQENELYKNQKAKVSLIKRLTKFLMVNFSRLIPLSIFPNKVYFIYSHHVFDDEFERFKSSILKLKKRFTFVSFEKAIELSNQKKLDKKYICLSFDDGMQNNWKAAEFLATQNIKAMFFINSEVIDKHQDYEYIKKHCNNKLHLKAIRFFSWESVKKLTELGHEIGNHGLSHKKLSKCNSEELLNEIEVGRTNLESKLNLNDFYFAWCYGTKKDITAEAIQIIRNNHKGVVSAIRGFNPIAEDFILRDLVVWYYSYHRIEFFYKINCLKKWT